MQAVHGWAPLVVHVNQADMIAAVLRLKHRFPRINMILAGATEAHVLADRIATLGKAVLPSAPW